MISVITPTYNRTEYIGQTIESFLMQDYEDKELIVVNDGSTKDYTEIMNQYVNEDGVSFLMCEHEGCASALNYGIREARGELICRLDDDDLLVGTDSLSLRANAFKARNLLEVVYTGYKRIYYDSKEMSTEKVKPLDKGRIWKSDYINMQSMMWRKSVHKKIGYFNEELQNNEDWEWKIRCLMECEVEALDLVTVASRYHGANKSIVNRDVTLQCADTLIKRMKKRYGHK